MHLNQISRQQPRRRPRRRPWLAGAALAACLAATFPAAAATASTAAAKPSPLLDCGPPDFFIRCYTPQAYEVAYGVAPLLSRGTDGRGETVVMPETAEAPSSHGVTYTDIRQDLAAFDRRFGLPYLAAIEEVEDTEMVHAIAPEASLRDHQDG
jgi:subtilase family serine protease